MRYLIEEATNIATSSVYTDYLNVKSSVPPHLKSPFPWGGYCPDHGYEGNRRYPQKGEIVVIKTHYPAYGVTKFDLKPCIKTIRIVRNPIDSFYSYHCHGRTCPEDEKIPKKKLKGFIDEWKRFQNYWNAQNNVITIYYEDLLAHPHENLELALTHIGYQFTPEDIERAVKKYPPQGAEYKHINIYSREQVETIKRELKDLLTYFDYEIPFQD